MCVCNPDCSAVLVHTCDTVPTPTGFAEIVGDCFSIRQPIRQAALNGEFGNSRDASVYADGAKSKFPKRVARALELRNSSRVATPIWGGARPRYRFRDYGPHSAQTEQRGETVLLIAPSRRSQFHFVVRPDVGRVYKSRFPSRCRFPTEALFFPADAPPALCSTQSGAGGPSDRNCSRASLYYLQRSAISA